MKSVDIAIIGAGPAGCATALRLAYSGIDCLLVDRATFPRDKICGDALSSKVSVLLDRLDPAIMDRLRARFQPIDVWGIRFVPPNRRTIDLPFKRQPEQEGHAQAPGYVSKRLDFDHFLIDEVRRHPGIELRTNYEMRDYERLPDGYAFGSQAGQPDYRCRLLIDASGAQSRFARLEGGLKMDRKHHAAAVRQYYKGVSGLRAGNFIELHFLNQLKPGYFWIFPLPNGEANVGLGMRSDILSRRKIDLKKALQEVVQSEAFRHRFAGAEPLEEAVGYGLPLGSKSRRLSGDHYLLTGDAGHLIDPLTGEGIGNAVYSGVIAAELAEKCLIDQRFDAEYLLAYDKRIKRVLRSEMRLSYRLQQIMKYAWLTNLLSSFIINNTGLIEKMSDMINDLDLRKQLLNPLFWLRGRKSRRPKAMKSRE